MTLVSTSTAQVNPPFPPPPPQGFNGIRTCGPYVRTAVLYQLSYEDPYNGKQANFMEFINPWKEWNIEWGKLWTTEIQMEWSLFYLYFPSSQFTSF